MTKKILIVVDVQRDFTPGGSLACPEGAAIIPNINKLINSGVFDMVVATQDWHPADHISFADNQGKQPFEVIDVAYGKQMLWPRHCVQGSNGAAFHTDLDTTKVNFILRKGMHKDVDSYSAFLENDKTTETGLSKLLDSPLYDIYVVGIATDVCVFNTAIDAKGPKDGPLAKLFTSVFVIEDACAGVTAEGHAKALKDLKDNNIYIVKTADVIEV